MVFLILWQICCFQSQTTMLKWLRLPSRDLIRHFQSEYPSTVSSGCPPGIDIAFRSEFCPQNTPILWTTRLKTLLYPQNTPFLWMKRLKTSLYPQNTPHFVDESAVSIPVGRLQSVRSAFLGALPGPNCRYSFRTALFKPLELARANHLASP